MKQEQSVTLLLLEAKAEWPTWSSSLRLNAAHSRVEVQQDSESLHEFHRRVQSVIVKLKEQGQTLKAAGYACSTDCTQATALGRMAVCQSILTLMQANVDEAELTIAGGAWASSGHEGMARVTLMELWGELSSFSQGPKVSVRFEDTSLMHEDSDLRLRPSDVICMTTQVSHLIDRVGAKGPVKTRLTAYDLEPPAVSALMLRLDIASDSKGELDESGT